MNKPLRRVWIISLVMFLGLFGSATWVQFFQAPSLNADSRNTRTLYREFGTNRGPIVVEGEEVAVSTPTDSSFKYQREYPEGKLYSAITGYYSIVYGRTGIERASNEYLNGTSDSLWWNRLEKLITGADPQGSAVELTIDKEAQKAAYDALGDQRGAAVAIEVETGRILALVSKPAFDPNDLAGHSSKEVNKEYQKLLNADGKPLANRALAGDTYPPGSVFKLVTAAAALENGIDPDQQLDAPDTYKLPGTSTNLNNFGGERCSGSGKQTLGDALRVSCNTAFAILGNQLGQQTIAEQAQAFGFESSIEVPMASAISRYPTDQNAAQEALSAIGQQDVRVTPLQVAMVSAAIANDGVVMQPYLVDRVRTADLTVVEETKPKEVGRAVSSETARELTDMMVGVVNNGTGSAAQIGGVAVAGKTGTAETGNQKSPHAWFTAFAPADKPKVAVAVIVENGGKAGSEATGGRVAAPIARSIIQAVLKQ